MMSADLVQHHPTLRISAGQPLVALHQEHVIVGSNPAPMNRATADSLSASQLTLIRSHPASTSL